MEFLSIHYISFMANSFSRNEMTPRCFNFHLLFLIDRVNQILQRAGHIFLFFHFCCQLRKQLCGIIKLNLSYVERQAIAFEILRNL